MKVSIPETIEDITLEQYQKYVKVIEREDLEVFERNNRIISIFCNIPYHDVKNINANDYDFIIETINNALNTKVDFKNRFTLDGIEFGFIPNFDKITSDEWFDLCTYDTKMETMHKLMAILFRPIEEKDSLGNYKIVPYDSTDEYENLMLRTPLNIVNGALGFFLTLGNELDKHIQKSIQVAQKREKQQASILKSGDGMFPSMN